jgi:hypothetical protein
VYGDSLYRTDSASVEFFTPGIGIRSFSYPSFDSLQDSQSLSGITGVQFTGPVKKLLFTAVAVQRKPASGTTAESYSLVSISEAPGGTPVIHQLWNLVDPTYDTFEVSTASSGASIGVFQSSGSSEGDHDLVAGVNLATGTVAWRYDNAQSNDKPMLDTMLVMVDTVQGFSITGCWDGSGVDIATGKVLFTTTLEPCSYWSTGYQNYTIGAGQGNDYRVYDRITGTPLLGWVAQGAYNGSLRYDPIGHLGVTGDYDWNQDLRVFDTSTGNVVYTMPLSQVEALRLEAVTIWDGKVYANTTDAMTVLDGRTGKVLANSVSWYPLVGVGGWTLYSDGLVTSAARPLD